MADKISRLPVKTQKITITNDVPIPNRQRGFVGSLPFAELKKPGMSFFVPMGWMGTPPELPVLMQRVRNAVSAAKKRTGCDYVAKEEDGDEGHGVRVWLLEMKEEGE